MEDGNTDVTITDKDGKKLPDEETLKLLKSLQAGVFYVPQRRR